jgi:hypothetical protein
VRDLLAECLKSLLVFTVVPVPENADSPIFVNLEILQTACANNDAVVVGVGRNKRSLSKEEAIGMFGVWVREKKLLDWYHVFISYRWGVDDYLVDGIADALMEEVIGTNYDLVNVFQDRKRLKNGDNFMERFIDAMFVTLVICPVVSRHAMDRMNLMVKGSSEKKSDVELEKQEEYYRSKADYTLLEWVLACQLAAIQDQYRREHGGEFHPTVRVVSVFPLLLEDIQTLLPTLANVEPITTWQLADSALRARGLEPIIPICTIRTFVSDYLMKYLCQYKFAPSLGGENFEQERERLKDTGNAREIEKAAAAACTKEIMEVLKNLDAAICAAAAIAAKAAAADIPLSHSTPSGKAATAMKFLVSDCSEADFEPDLLSVTGEVTKCVGSVMEVLNELNVEQPSRPTSGKAGGGSASKSPPTPPSTVEGIEAAWEILQDVNQHENAQSLAKLIADVGIIDSTYLRKCTTSEVESVAALLKPAPRRKFKELLANIGERDLQQAWGILNNEKRVRDPDGLRQVLEDEGILEEEDLEGVQREKLIHIGSFLKPAGEDRFKRAMKLG